MKFLGFWLVVPCFAMESSATEPHSFTSNYLPDFQYLSKSFFARLIDHIGRPILVETGGSTTSSHWSTS